MNYIPGTWCWTELNTTNAESAKEFYNKLFDWSHRVDPNPTSETYTTLLKDHLEVGALYQIQEKFMHHPKSHWNNYVAVEDLEITLNSIKQAGGKVVFGPMEVSGIGQMAACEDDQGAAFSVWQPHGFYGSNLNPETEGAVGWRELHTTDTHRAMVFYQKVFGWIAEDWSNDSGYYAMLYTGEYQVCGMRKLPHNEGAKSYWNTCFTVKNTEDTTAKAQELGATLVNEPLNLPDIGTLVTLKDKEGAVFTIAKWNTADEA